MLVNETYTHGGASDPEIRLDFSINVNPLGMPENVKESLLTAVSEAEKYPDAACRRLVKKLSEKLKISKEQLILGNGADELIYGYVRALKEYYGVKKVLLFAPAFGEYERALMAEGIEIIYEVLSDGFMLTEENCRAMEKADAVFLCSPSNPSGRLIPSPMLKRIIRRTKELGKKCFLDLCFFELSAGYEPELTEELLCGGQNSHLAIVSAFTKTYAIAGVRLGYLMSSDTGLISFLSKHTQCWNVSVFAQAAGLACLENAAYVEKSRAYIAEEREYLMQRLKSLVSTVYPSEANYILMRDSVPYAKELKTYGILVRDCSNYYGLSEGYFRVAVRSHAENEALIAAMEECHGK